MTSDSELLRRYAAGCAEPAFAELVRRHLNLVYSAALRQVGGDAHRAEEVAQAVFNDLARKAASLAGRASLAGWLHTSTRFAAAKVVRADVRRREIEAEAQTMPERFHALTPSAEWERLRPTIDEAVQGLREPEREAVLLRFFAGRSFAEIGATLALSEDAARMRVERALEKLRVRLARRGVTSSAAALGALLASEATFAAPAYLAASIAGSAVTSAGVAVGSTAAGSALGGGALAGVVHFMSTAKLAVGLVGLAVMATFGGALGEMRAGQRNEAAVAAARLENEALAARLRALRQQSETANAAAPPVRSAAQSGAAQNPSPSPASSEAETNAYLARHPELHDALRRHVRARAAGTHAVFLRTHPLSPAQLERFLDLAGPALGMGYQFTGPDDAQLHYRSANAERAAARRELQAMLGEERFRDLAELSVAGSLARQLPTQLAAALYYTTAPLTAEQAERLQRILRDRQVRPDATSPKQPDWNAIFSDVAEVLIEPQLATLRHLRTLEETDRALFTIR